LEEKKKDYDLEQRIAELREEVGPRVDFMRWSVSAIIFDVPNSKMYITSMQILS
jgi:hypothetical protein